MQIALSWLFFLSDVFLEGAKRTRRLLMRFHREVQPAEQWCLSCCRAEPSPGLAANVA